MPHEPQKFIDKEHAEMMVYALEEHFLRISELLDSEHVPDRSGGGKRLTTYQRVWILSRMGGKPLCPVSVLRNHVPDDDEGEDPEELAEKIAALYGEK